MDFPRSSSVSHFYSNQSKEGCGWSSEYFQTIGLEEFVAEQFERIGGSRVAPMGTPTGKGLSAGNAKDMGLWEGCPVAIGTIDAHAGCLGVVGIHLED